MAEIETHDPKISIAKTTYDKATALRIELHRSFADTKAEVTAFFKNNLMLASLAPDATWYGSNNTDLYLDALEKARLAIQGLNNIAVSKLQSKVDDLLAETLVAEPGEDDAKTAIKSEAHEFLKEHGAQSFGRRIWRGAHTPSVDLIRRLETLRTENVGNTAMVSKIDQHIEKLEPLTLKKRVIALFESKEYTDFFGHNGAEGFRKYFRFAHTPMADLRQALEKSQQLLLKYSGEAGRQLTLDQIETLKKALNQRKEIKEQLAETEKRAAGIFSSFRANERNIHSFAKGLEEKSKTLKSLIKSKETELASAWEALAKLENRLNELKLNEEGGSTAEGESAISETEAQIAQKHALIAKLDQEIITTEDELIELATLMGYCSDHMAQIKVNQVTFNDLRENYERNKTLIVYFKLGDDVGTRLNSVALALRQGQSSLHAIASLKVIFIFEAGVRLGFDLGFVALQGKVGMSMVLSGTMAILESRELMFSFRFALYFCLSGKLQAGTPVELKEALEAVALNAPEDLINASAAAQCSLVDREDCIVYPNESVWAAQWSHQITRRTVFLNRYNASISASEITPEWLDNEITRMGTSMENFPDLSKETQQRIREAIARDKEKLLLLKTACKGITLQRPPAELNASGKIEALGKERAATEGTFSATFNCMERTLSDDDRETISVAFGKLEESACYFTGSDDSVGEAVYHSFTPVHHATPSRRYLEVKQQTSNSADFELLQAEWVSNVAKPPVTPEMLLLLSTAVNFKPPQIYADSSPRVYLPKNACETISLESRDRLALEIGGRLQKLRSGAEVNKTLKKLLEAPEKIESAAESASSTTESTSELLNIDLGCLQQLITFAKETAGTLKEMKEGIEQKTSNCAYLRYVNQHRVTNIELASGEMTTHEAWTPQVYRALSQQKINTTIPIPDVPVLPGISVYFDATIECKREVSQYELLGTDTFSYLKMMYKRNSAVLFTAYLDLHWPEVENILRNVTITGSGAFSEICIDYFDSHKDRKLSSAARMLADRCFQHYAADKTNPFKDEIKDFQTRAGKKNLSQLKRLFELQATLEASLQSRLHSQALQTSAAMLTSGPEGWSKLYEVYMGADDERSKLIATFKDTFNRSVDHPAIPSDQSVYRPVLETTHNQLSGLLEALSGMISHMGSLGDRAVFAKRVHYALQLLEAMQQTIEPEKLPHIDLSLSMAVDPYACTLPQRLSPPPESFLANPEKRTLMRPEPENDQDAQQLWKKDPLCPWNYFAGSLFTEEGQYANGGNILLNNGEVPREWRENRGLSVMATYLMPTSLETTTLKNALNNYHVKLSHCGRVRFNPQEPANTHHKLRQYINNRLDILDELLRAITIWKVGKPGKPRDEGLSRRMPNVVMLLEVPALADKLSLTRLQMCLALRWYIHNVLSQLKDLDTIANYADPLPLPEEITLTIREALLEYLDKSEDDEPHHPLLHGMKQVKLPNDAHKVHDVSE